MKTVLFADQTVRQPDGWLSSPRAFSEVAQSINALLQVIDPDVHPSVLAELREIFETGDPTDDIAKLEALSVAEAIAFPDLKDNLEMLDIPLAAVIRSWL